MTPLLRRLLPAALGVLAGCRALPPALLAPAPGAALPARLSPLLPELQLRHLGLGAGPDSLAVAADLATLLRRELRQVLAAPAGPGQGYAVLTVHQRAFGRGGGYSYLSGLAVGSLTLLGLPWLRYHCTLDVFVDVRNRRRELLGTYYAPGQAVSADGLYHRHYRERDHLRAVYLGGVRQALAAIRPQLAAEAARLQAGLAR